MKAGSPDWAAQLQECRGWWRGECDNIFELSLFNHLSTKIKKYNSSRAVLSHDRRGCSAPAGLISSFRPSESLPRRWRGFSAGRRWAEVVRPDMKEKTPIKISGPGAKPSLALCAYTSDMDQLWLKTKHFLLASQTGGLQQVVNKCTAKRFHFAIQEDNNYSKENPQTVWNC